MEKLLNRFHLVARQLTQRQRKKKPFVITDEYDVQDLLHALLKIEFDNVKLEEPTPSLAGKPAYMDILLPTLGIVIETKMTRKGLTEKGVGDELLIDIARYQEHEGCRTLVCFVYDPGQWVKNPMGLKSDLEKKSTERLAVVVIVCQH